MYGQKSCGLKIVGQMFLSFFFFFFFFGQKLLDEMLLDVMCLDE